MSLPYFPMYPTDFEADTSHLTLAEDGAYNRLLRLMWMTAGCSLPDDDAWILRRMRCFGDEDSAVVLGIISEFFQRKGGRIVNSRLAKEYQKTDLAHKKRVAAGSKGGAAKALNAKESASSKAKAMPKQPEPEPDIKREAKASLSPSAKTKTGTRLPDDWFLSKHLGEWSISEGATAEMVRAESAKFRDYWIGVAGAKGRKADWDATWRNWIRKAIADQKPKLTAINGGSNNGQPASKSAKRIQAWTQGARGTFEAP